MTRARAGARSLQCSGSSLLGLAERLERHEAVTSKKLVRAVIARILHQLRDPGLGGVEVARVCRVDLKPRNVVGGLCVGHSRPFPQMSGATRNLQQTH
jgi:hypothetical protein